MLCCSAPLSVTTALPVLVMPLGSVAVAVYVTVPAGWTVTLPPLAGVTAPTPWSMLTLAAFVADQVSVTACPDDEMVLGEAVKVTAIVETVTVAVAVVVPPAPCAVAVKVVVCVMGLVVTLPDAGDTEPIPLLIVSEVAFAVDHVSVEVPPDFTAVGKAENWIVGAVWFTVTVTVCVVVPPGPVAVRVYVVVWVGVTAPWPLRGMLVTSSCGRGGVMVTIVAFVVVHDMVLNCPAVIVVGEAASVADGDAPGVGVGNGVGAGVGVGVGVGLEKAEEVPAHPEMPATQMPITRVTAIARTTWELRTLVSSMS